jgi:hypothetical protein
MRLAMLIGMLALVPGCATRSSGILKLGPDTYTTSASAGEFVGGSTEGRRMALTDANEHCAKLGKEIMVTNIAARFGNKTEVTFRCLSKDDPGLQRPEIKQVPDVTIEDRRK